MTTELFKVKEQIDFDNFRYELGLSDVQIKYILDNMELFSSTLNEVTNSDLQDEIDELGDEIRRLEEIKDEMDEKIDDLNTKIKSLSDNNSSK